MFLSILYQPNSKIPAGFSNPPTNVRCSVRFKDRNYFPRVSVRWDPPDFHAVPGYNKFEYEVYAERGLDVTTRTGTLEYVDIDLGGVDDLETVEGVYGFYVRNLAQYDGTGDYSSAPARCDFNTVTRGLWIHQCV